MHKTLAAIAAVTTIAAAASAMPTPANATDLSVGIRGAVGEVDLATPAYFACRRVWRCGPFACGFRPVCWGAPVRAYGAYGFYRPWRYGYWHRPYWRHHWY